MSIQAQAYTISEVSPVTGGYVRPQFRVVEGGLKDHKAHKDNGNKTAAHEVVAFVPSAAPAPSCRKAIILAAFALAAFALAWGLTDVFMARAQKAAFSQVSYETIVVHAGDSLWTIADEHPVDGRTTEEVARYIRDYNDLDSSCLYAGMELSVPRQAMA